MTRSEGSEAPSRDRSRCLFCGVRLDAHVSCVNCGREAAPPDAKSSRELDIACPRCFIGLELSTQTDEWAFLYCIGCHGCFVPPADWGMVIEHALATAEDQPIVGEELKVLPPHQGLASSALAGAIGCPVCRVDMERSTFHGASEDVDICSLHGIWFDAAELASVLRRSGKPAESGTPTESGRPAESEPPRERRVRQRSAIDVFARLLARG